MLHRRLLYELEQAFAPLVSGSLWPHSAIMTVRLTLLRQPNEVLQHNRLGDHGGVVPLSGGVQVDW